MERLHAQSLWMPMESDMIIEFLRSDWNHYRYCDRAPDRSQQQLEHKCRYKRLMILQAAAGKIKL
jgi:hypothetical protein